MSTTNRDFFHRLEQVPFFKRFYEQFSTYVAKRIMVSFVQMVGFILMAELMDKKFRHSFEITGKLIEERPDATDTELILQRRYLERN